MSAKPPRQFNLTAEVFDHVRAATVLYGWQNDVDADAMGFAALICAYGLLQASGLTHEEIRDLLDHVAALGELPPVDKGPMQ